MQCYHSVLPTCYFCKEMILPTVCCQSFIVTLRSGYKARADPRSVWPHLLRLDYSSCLSLTSTNASITKTCHQVTGLLVGMFSFIKWLRFILLLCDWQRNWGNAEKLHHHHHQHDQSLRNRVLGVESVLVSIKDVAGVDFTYEPVERRDATDVPQCVSKQARSVECRARPQTTPSSSSSSTWDKFRGHQPPDFPVVWPNQRARSVADLPRDNWKFLSRSLLGW